jgi:ABC-type hemin transport system ATPase subunit
LIRRLTWERNLATICVLHGINLASSIADSMVLLGENGRIVAAGTPEVADDKADHY